MARKKTKMNVSSSTSVGSATRPDSRHQVLPARTGTSSPPPSNNSRPIGQLVLRGVWLITLVFLLGLCCLTSQSHLRPLFGSVPTSYYFPQCLFICLFLSYPFPSKFHPDSQLSTVSSTASSSSSSSPPPLSTSNIFSSLAVASCAASLTPLITNYFSILSGGLGPVWGPVFTQLGGPWLVIISGLRAGWTVWEGVQSHFPEVIDPKNTPFKLGFIGLEMIVTWGIIRKTERWLGSSPVFVILEKIPEATMFQFIGAGMIVLIVLALFLPSPPNPTSESSKSLISDFKKSPSKRYSKRDENKSKLVLAQRTDSSLTFFSLVGSFGLLFTTFFNPLYPNITFSFSSTLPTVPSTTGRITTSFSLTPHFFIAIDYPAQPLSDPSSSAIGPPSSLKILDRRKSNTGWIVVGEEVVPTSPHHGPPPRLPRHLIDSNDKTRTLEWDENVPPFAPYPPFVIPSLGDPSSSSSLLLQDLKNYYKSWGEFQWSRVRFLRADHSLLGGLWTGPTRVELWQQRKKEFDDDERERAKSSKAAEAGGERRTEFGIEMEKEVINRSESVYTTFLLQEGVRFVDRGKRLNNRHDESEEQETALVIGLGAGVVVRSFAAFNISTTLVEIDPAVYELASKWFGVESPEGGVYLEDARYFLKNKRGKVETKFDYVIHDVFTGGTVPSSLFTLECWSDVKSVLKTSPPGVVAINFAGDLSSKSASLVLKTLLASFANCRAFKDGSGSGDEDHENFQNMVVFCNDDESGRTTKGLGEEGLRFRNITTQDKMMMDANEVSPRQRAGVFSQFLDHEVDLGRFSSESQLDKGAHQNSLLKDGEEWKLEKAQLDSAFGHWKMMRKAMGDEMWRFW